MVINSRIRMLISAVVAAVLLSGCVSGVLLGGTAIVGGVSALDRRSTGALADDGVMSIRIKSTALPLLGGKQADGFTPKLTVVSYNRRILLLGQVATERQRAIVEQVARSEQAVQEIYNYIRVVQHGSRQFSNVAEDIWNTSKVRTTLLGVKGLVPNHVKIVTYDGITYVMGILTPDEQAAVTERVRTTSGVKSVITLYQVYKKR